MTKTDIRDRKDIEHLLNVFYTKVFADPVIGKIFTEVAQLDLQKHLPVIANFWEAVLFEVNAYSGNPMKIHSELNEKFALQFQHFERWLSLWEESIDENFVGEMAEKAKARAKGIAMIIQSKINPEKE